MTFLPVRTGILFFHVHPQIFSGIFVDNLCSKKFGLDVVIYVLLKNIHMHSLNLLNLIYIVACNSTREYQINDSRATRIANFPCPLPTMVGCSSERFPHEHFLAFSKK